MSEYIEIPDELPESWPTEWKGNTTIKCGDRGYQLKILTQGHPSRVHLENYKEILHRWDGLWPQAFKIITQMIADYGYEYKLMEDSFNFPMLDMRIPNEHY